MEPIIKVDRVKVVYNPGKDNEFTALKDISLEIYPEEYVIFYGPSGCGKSTLLYVIMGLQRVAEGKIFVQGKDISTFTTEERQKKLSHFFGIIFQSFNLIFSLNVIDNVMLPLVFSDIPMADRRKRALELLRRFGIESRADNLAGKLSGGQQQRTAICRALINNPVALFADEPVGNLDNESADIVMDALFDINVKDKRTVILVTHDSRYLSFADRIFYFENGTIAHVERNQHKSKYNVNSAVEPPVMIDTDGKFVSLPELEKMARTHPAITVPELMAWSFTNFMTEELTTHQVARLEGAMERLLGGKMGEYRFYEFLHESYGQGGVGLYSPTARRYTAKISNILKTIRRCCAQGEKFVDVLKDLKRRPQAVSVLSSIILEDVRQSLSVRARGVLSQAISQRVGGEMTAEQFSHQLDLSESRGGVGLRVITAERVTDKLNMILAQAQYPQKGDEKSHLI